MPPLLPDRWKLHVVLHHLVLEWGRRAVGAEGRFLAPPYVGHDYKPSQGVKLMATKSANSTVLIIWRALLFADFRRVPDRF